MNVSRRTVIAATATAIGTVGCTAGGDDEDPEIDDLSLILNWQPGGLHVPYYVADARGFYDDEGLSVAIESGEGSDYSAREAARGNSNLGITSSDQVLNINSRDLSLTSVAIVMQRGPVVLFSSRDQFGEELTDPDQLEGLTVGSGPGMVRVMTQSYLDHHDLLEGVEYVDSGFDTIQQLLSGDIDVAGGVFSDVVDARHQDATVDVLATHDTIPSYGHLIAGGDDFLDNHPNAVRAFISATARGAAWAANNPDGAIDELLDAVPELSGTEPNQRDKWRELADQYMVSPAVEDHAWGWSTNHPWEETHDVLESGDFLEDDVDPSAVWTNDFLDTDDEDVGGFSDQLD